MQNLEQLRSGSLTGAKKIKLACGLTEFPGELFSLVDTLELLDLSGNRLSSLPNDLGKFSKLKIIFLSDNLFTSLPEVLSDCQRLEMIGFKSNQISFVPENALPLTTRWLILTNNKIRRLPAGIGNCRRLQKVALAGNLLEELPVEMANCRNLELLRISANRLKIIPSWLLKMPKLAWLAFAGNAFNEKQSENSLTEINWNEFELSEQLGEGASGNIYKAKRVTNKLEVAIKVFKGEVTSDGFPADEMTASIAAGEHPNMIRLLGKIKDHPQQKQGLVMELVLPDFNNLGNPPNFETCSRDTFNAGTFFSATQIFSITNAIASVAAHLHSKGIMHGDLYAHNILVNKKNMCLMSDFGAASFYDKNSINSKHIQQIESRAFGYLIEDLLQHFLPGEEKTGMIFFLQELKNDLLSESVSDRPLFDECLERFEEFSM